jgi:hypothetical protein
MMPQAAVLSAVAIQKGRLASNRHERPFERRHAVERDGDDEHAQDRIGA